MLKLFFKQRNTAGQQSISCSGEKVYLTQKLPESNDIVGINALPPSVHFTLSPFIFMQVCACCVAIHARKDFQKCLVISGNSLLLSPNGNLLKARFS